VDRIDQSLATILARIAKLEADVDQHDKDIMTLEMSADTSDVTVDVHDHEERLVALESARDRLIHVVNHNSDELNELERFAGFVGATQCEAPPLAAEPAEPLRPAHRPWMSWKERITAYLEGWNMPVRQIDIIKEGLGWDDDRLGHAARRRMERILQELGWTRTGRGGRGDPFRWVKPAPAAPAPDPLRVAVVAYVNDMINQGIKQRELRHHLIRSGVATIHDMEKVRSILADLGLVREQFPGGVLWSRPEHVIAQELPF
jgi:hypothetical protein